VPRRSRRRAGAAAPAPTGASGATSAPAAARGTGPPPAPTRPTAGRVFRVESAEEAEELARHLLDPERSHPVVLVTRAAGQAAPYVDVGSLTEPLQGLAEVWELPTGPLSWAFAHAMPPLCDVYGGAARVYPPGRAWASDPYAAPLRFVYGPADGPAAVAQLTTDALRAVRAEGSFGAAAAGSVAVEGTVMGVTAGRGLVSITRGAAGMASIWTELVATGVEDGRLLRRGMAVAGLLDLSSRRLDVSGARVPPGEALARYEVGSVVLGLVRSVERALCVVDLLPDHPVAIEPEDVVATSRPVDLRRLITEGEVLLAKVVERGELPEDWRLSLVAVEPDEAPLPAPSILRGGPPWLAPPASDEDALAPVAVVEAPAAPPAPPRAVVPAPASAPASPGPAGGASASGRPGEEALQALQALAIERDNLLAELQRQREAAHEAARELTALRTGMRRANRRLEHVQGQLNEALAELGRSANDEALFGDRLEQLRFEVSLAWARRVPADQKRELPLAPWSVGPDFFASWDAVQGVARSKVVEVVVEVLSGLVFQVAGRELHQLRTGPGGDDPVRTRADGATCWRVSLQVRTPSARRLHYWQLNDGSIELSSIRLHDDMHP